MNIALPDLPYATDALEPHISERTVMIHHDRHQRAYVEKTNELIRNSDIAEETLDAIVMEAAHRATSIPGAGALYNNAAQAWNHAFYWRSLRPRSKAGPRGALATHLHGEFGDVVKFGALFANLAVSHFGSGWAWLVADGASLKIVTTGNADTPMVQGQRPLLGIDLWEHSYYLDYQERRAEHVNATIKHLLNWEFASTNYESTRSSSNPARASQPTAA